MKAVVLYESADDLAAKAPLHSEAHCARWAEFARRGELLMIGPFANAQEDGSMAIFTTREAAEEFVRGDPFVVIAAGRCPFTTDGLLAVADLIDRFRARRGADRL